MAFVLLANTACGEEERKHALCCAMSGHCRSVRAAFLKRKRGERGLRLRSYHILIFLPPNNFYWGTNQTRFHQTDLCRSYMWSHLPFIWDLTAWLLSQIFLVFSCYLDPQCLRRWCNLTFFYCKFVAHISVNTVHAPQIQNTQVLMSVIWRFSLRLEDNQLL